MGVNSLGDRKFSKRSAYLNPEVRQLMGALARRMMAGLKADLYALFGWEQDHQRLAFLQAHDQYHQSMAPWNGHAAALIASPAMQTALATGLTVTVTLNRNSSPAEKKVLKHFSATSLALVPIGGVQQPLGVICLLMKPAGTVVGEREVRLLDALAAQGTEQINQHLEDDGLRRVASQIYDKNLHDHSFLSAVSRDLRSPLGTILGLVELMRAGNFGQLPGDLDHPMERVMCSAGVLMDTVNELLEWGRMGSLRFVLNPEWIDLETWLDKQVRFLEPLVAGKSQEETAPDIEVDCPAALPRVFVDGARLRQIINNLVMTLLNVANDGKISITCQQAEINNRQLNSDRSTRSLQLPEGQWVLVTLQSDDLDVAPDTRLHMASACAQPAGKEETWPDGSLGLIIAKRLLALHGSTVWVNDAESDQGLRLTFALPAQPQQVWIGRKLQGIEPSPSFSQADYRNHSPAWQTIQ